MMRMVARVRAMAMVMARARARARTKAKATAAATATATATTKAITCADYRSNNNDDDWKYRCCGRGIETNERACRCLPRPTTAALLLIAAALFDYNNYNSTGDDC